MTHKHQSIRIVTDAALADPSVMRLEPRPHIASVDGWAINIADQKTAIDAIVTAAKAGGSFTVFTLNLDHLVKLRSSDAFQRAYRAATFVTADGEPVARLARRNDPAIVRTTGADLMLPLADACAEAGLPVFLFGTSPGVLAKAGARLVQNTGGRIEIAGTLAPPAAFDPEGPEADAAIARIAASGARICFVALGAPKQEIFAARAQAQGVRAGFVCIGASLDFLAGEQIRAPRAFQRAGLEWLWRLGSNPRRLAARYAQCALLLAELTLLAPLGGGSTGRRSP
ncbi:MAG: WecB/TagA/CpsF family glycosyltransferase [Hyphomonas sp.]|nr:WecB/TagA/CpsF family glycosyltransferase [Hyphomonas sp.]